MKHTIDATNKSVGRIATEIAHILQGKNTAVYIPRVVGTDSVEVTNASKMKISSPGKLEGKKYYRHSGVPGNLKIKTMGEALEKDPTWVVKAAVNKMLPKNRLRQPRMLRLTVKP